jgi:hypothetical protein
MIKGARSISPDLSRRSLLGSEEAGTVAFAPSGHKAPRSIRNE